MGVKSSVDIINPAADTLKMLSSISDAGKFIASVQGDPKFFTNLGQQLQSVYALTQPEKDERDAAALAVSQSQDKLDALQQQYSALQVTMANAKTASDNAVKAAKEASDAYVKGQNQTVSDRWKALDAYKTELDNREIAAQEADTANTAAAKQNKADAAANASLKEQLTNFANALRAFAPNVPVLEQAATE